MNTLETKTKPNQTTLAHRCSPSPSPRTEAHKLVEYVTTAAQQAHSAHAAVAPHAHYHVHPAAALRMRQQVPTGDAKFSPCASGCMQCAIELAERRSTLGAYSVPPEVLPTFVALRHYYRQREQAQAKPKKKPKKKDAPKKAAPPKAAPPKAAPPSAEKPPGAARRKPASVAGALVIRDS